MSGRSTFRRLVDLYRPHRARMAVAVVFMALAAAVPGVLVHLVEQVLDRVLIERDAVALARMPFAVAGLYVVKGLGTVAYDVLTRSAGFRVVAELRKDLHDHVLRLEPDWHQQLPSGARVARLTHDVDEVAWLVRAFSAAIQKPLELLGLLVAALVMDVWLTLSALAVLPLVGLAIDRFGRRLRASARALLRSVSALSAEAQETLGAIPVVQAFRAEAGRARRFAELAERHAGLQLRTALAEVLPGPVVEALAAVGVGLVIAVGGARVFRGELLPGELVGFLVAIGLMNMPLKGLSQMVSHAQRALAGAERVFEVLDRPPRVAGGGARLEAAEVVLAFEGVGYDYGDGPVLEDVSFTVAPGERVAVVGASGAGKTTLASLVPRFRDPTRGRVCFNGRDVRTFTLDSLRRHVALVTQEPMLFDLSVADNVRLGRPEASDEAVRAACRAANADGFIRALPRGYDTPLHEAGRRLSGGQRQRICIARAILLDAPVLVLDEATSNLDRESEAAVREALERLAARRTTLVVAHQLHTVRSADRIVVLDRGRVVEVGRHEELLARGGEYARLWAAG